eukprot:scaffold10369_cov80-Cylindrotheca_fusiformis.AAC.1
MKRLTIFGKADLEAKRAPMSPELCLRTDFSFVNIDDVAKHNIRECLTNVNIVALHKFRDMNI